MHKCKVCEQAFRDKEQLKKHQVIHTKEAAYMCEVCGWLFEHRKLLLVHQRIHKRQREQQQPIHQQEKGRKPLQKRQQPIHQGHLQRHQQQKPIAGSRLEPVDVQQPSSVNTQQSESSHGQWPTQVEIQTTAAMDMQNTVMYSSVPQCMNKQQQSNVTVNSQQSNPTITVDTSQNFVSTQGGNFRPISTTTSIPGSLVDNQNAFSQSMLGQFPSSAELQLQPRRASKSHHRNCALCGKAYFNIGNLKRHLGTHLICQPCVCVICGAKEFTKPEDLITHLVSHCQQVYHACHRCATCQEAFSCANDLDLHLRLYHQREDMRVDHNDEPASATLLSSKLDERKMTSVTVQNTPIGINQTTRPLRDSNVMTARQLQIQRRFGAKGGEPRHNSNTNLAEPNASSSHQASMPSHSKAQHGAMSTRLSKISLLPKLIDMAKLKTGQLSATFSIDGNHEGSLAGLSSLAEPKCREQLEMMATDGNNKGSLAGLSNMAESVKEQSETTASTDDVLLKPISAAAALDLSVMPGQIHDGYANFNNISKTKYQQEVNEMATVTGTNQDHQHLSPIETNLNHGICITSAGNRSWTFDMERNLLSETPYQATDGDISITSILCQTPGETSISSDMLVMMNTDSPMDYHSYITPCQNTTYNMELIEGNVQMEATDLSVNTRNLVGTAAPIAGTALAEHEKAMGRLSEVDLVDELVVNANDGQLPLDLSS